MGTFVVVTYLSGIDAEGGWREWLGGGTDVFALSLCFGKNLVETIFFKFSLEYLILVI